MSMTVWGELEFMQPKGPPPKLMAVRRKQHPLCADEFKAGGNTLHVAQGDALRIPKLLSPDSASAPKSEIMCHPSHLRRNCRAGLPVCASAWQKGSSSAAKAAAEGCSAALVTTRCSSGRSRSVRWYAKPVAESVSVGSRISSSQKLVVFLMTAGSLGGPVGGVGGG